MITYYPLFADIIPKGIGTLAQQSLFSMEIFDARQVQKWELATSAYRHFKSSELMEQAANTFLSWLQERVSLKNRNILVLAGPGNNGGDALAVARLLHFRGLPCQTIRYTDHLSQCSQENELNYKRLVSHTSPENCVSIQHGENPVLPTIHPNTVIIDGLFGNGLNRKLEGFWAQLVAHASLSSQSIYSIDLPSGLAPNINSASECCIRATETLSFEIPKLCFFMPEYEHLVGRWECRPIGLIPSSQLKIESDYHYQTIADAKRLLKNRNRFSHKGTCGHSLLICGSEGKIGAAVLAASAALKSGSGLVSLCIPARAEVIVQSSLPEAMVIKDPHEYHWTTPLNTGTYDAIGIGCGTGTFALTSKALEMQLGLQNPPMVIDADALNLIARYGIRNCDLPQGTILTPHQGEFQRLFGNAKSSMERWNSMKNFSKELGVFIVLKGANTAISTPNGKIYFNSSGNQGMSTAGSGDSLTGIITSLLSQGYPPESAARLGVFWHGLAGDIAYKGLSYESITASDIINHLGIAMKQIVNFKA